MEIATDFDFYLKFTRPLILNLEKTSDKVLAAAWVKKLLDKDSGDENIRLSYLKLLLFVLQRRVMAPPFSQHPNNVEVLSPLPEDKTLVDVAKDIIEKEQQEKRERAQKRLKKDSGDYPPYVSDFSADLLEYVAVQDIKNFGVHGYYAVSKLPLNTWYRVDKQFLPKAAKSMIEVIPGPPPLLGTASEPSITQEKTQEKPAESTPEQPSSEKPAKKPPEEKPPDKEPTSEEQKKKRPPKKSTMGASPPSRPIGKVSPHFEEREPPTWGSNLLEVIDVIQETQEFDLPETSETSPHVEMIWPPYISRDVHYENDYVDTAPEDDPSFLSSGFIESEALDSSMMHGSPQLPFSPPSPINASSPTVTEEKWPSAASLPYATPPYPSVTPPPPGLPTPPPPKKRVPKVKPTRASLLLQKKKEEALAPPPPPPSKKPPRKPKPVPPRSSKIKTQEKEEVAGPSVEEEKEPIKKVPSKKGIPQLKGKKSTRKKQVIEKAGEIIKDISVSGEEFKGFDNMEDINAHLQEYNQMLQEMENKYRKDVEAYQGKWPEKQAEQQEKESIKQAQVVKSAPSPGKDRRISSFYEKMISSIQMSPIAEAEQEDWEVDQNIQQEHIEVDQNIQQEHTEMDAADISRQGEVSVLEAVPATDDLEEEMKRRGEDPNAQLEQLTELEAVPEEMDFEELEKAIEQEMRVKGEDPHARAKQPKMSRKAFVKGRQRYLDVHARIDSQLENLEQADEDEGEIPPVSPSKLKAELAQHKIYDPKRQMMRRSVKVKGKNVPLKKQPPGLATIHETPPQKRSPQPDPSSRLPSEPKSIFPVGEQELEGLDDVEWVSGPEYFADKKIHISPYKDPRAKSAEEVFPSIDFGEEEKLEESFFTDEMLDEFLAESPPTTPDRRFKMMREVEELYHELVQASPGLAGIPVTVPRPTTSPRRPVDYSQITFTPPKSPPDPYGLPAVERYSTVDRFVQYLRKRQEQARTTVRRTPPKVKTPSPPPPSTPKDLEDDIFITTPPKEIADVETQGFDEEYVSPLKLYTKLKDTQPGLGADISPPNKDWYMQMQERRKQFYGSPKKEVPDIFDVPYERVAGETPPKLVSPERPPLSPPIDAPQLREHIRSQYTPRPPSLPYRRRVGPKHIVNRYSHPSSFLTSIQEAPDKEGLTQEDLDLQEHLKTMKKKKRGREEFELQSQRGKRKTVIQRHAPAPKLSPVKEDQVGEVFASPPKTVPDVFDLPDMGDKMWTETPPRGFSETPSVSPPLSPADPKSWKTTIRQQPTAKYRTPYKRTVGGKYKVRRKSPAPKLGMVSEAEEYLDEEDLERKRFISQQGRVPRKTFPKISEPIILSTVPEHIEYPDSPVSTRQIPASPRGTEGPRRRELRKRLKKKRLDFSIPSSPDEAFIENEQLEIEVGSEPERNIADLYTLEDLKLSPGVYEALRTPPQQVEGVSPKTPPVNLLDLEEEPELMNELLYVTPPSPMSQPEAIEKMKQEVREHQLIQPRHPRRKIRDIVGQRPGNLLEVEELPLQEAAARIHEEIEAEVEAELAAQEAAQRERERSVLDEPVPAELPSPMKPQQQVPFYETPPHLRKVPKKVEKKIDVWPAKYRDVLTHEEMPELVSPEQPSPPLATALPYFKRGVQYSPRGYIATQEERLRSPKLAEEEMPPDMASPTSPLTAEDIEKKSQLQYASLLTPGDRKQQRPKVNISASLTAEDIEKMSELQYASLLTPSDRKQQRPQINTLDGVPQSPELDMKKLTAPETIRKVRRVPDRDYPEHDQGTYKDDEWIGGPEFFGVADRPWTPQRPHPLPLPIKSQSPESPSPEHMAKMYAKLKETDSKMQRYPMRVKGKVLPTRYKDLPQCLPEVAESADEYKPPSPMGWNMRWDLSPEARVNLRIPDVQVPESPLKTSRYEFERVELQEPPPTRFQQPLPLVMSTDQALLWPIAHELGLETDDLELGLEYTSAPQDLVPPIRPDVFDRIEKLSEGYEAEHLQDFDLEGVDQRMEEEEPPEDFGFEPALTPPRPPPKSPEPVSPSKLKGELEKHQIYDPKRRKMRRSVKIKGRKVPLKIQYPGLETIYEGSPPKTWEELEAETDRQYQELMSTIQLMEQTQPCLPEAHPSSPGRPLPSPPLATFHRPSPSPHRPHPSPSRPPQSPSRPPQSPSRPPQSPSHPPPSPRLIPSPPPLPPCPPRFPTPSPERFKHKVDEHEFDPGLFHKTFVTKIPPNLSPQIEALEDLVPSSPIHRVIPLGIPVPQHVVNLESEQPPTMLYAEFDDICEEYEEPDIWQQSFVDEGSPLQLYVSPVPSPDQEFMDVEDWEPQIMDETPPFSSITPEQELVDFAPVYKGLIPSPKSPCLCKLYSPPFTEEGFGLPTVLGFEEIPETPKRPMKKLPKRPARRLKFDPTPTSPTSPETPEGPHVQVLEVEVQIHSPKKTPSPRPPTPPLICDEEMPSFIQEADMVEEYEICDSPTRVPDNLIPFGGRTSPGILDTSPIYYEEDIPEHLRGFKWMDQ